MSLFEASRENKPRLDRVVGGIVTLVVFLVYLVTLSPGFFPGISASFAAQVSGLLPSQYPDHPLWTLVSQGIIKVFGISPLPLNIFSLICGTVSVYLMYRLMSKAIAKAIQPEISSGRVAVRASVLGGVFAAVALAFCLPVWISSTRFQPHAWDLMWLMVAFSLLFAYVRGRRLWYVAPLAFIFGAGIVETPGFIPFAIVSFVWLLAFRMKSRAGFKGRYLAILLIFGILGLCMYIVAGLRFAAENTLADFDYKSIFDVVWALMLVQYRWCRFFFAGHTAWILVTLFSFVPWVVMQLTARRSLNEARDFVFYLLHFAWTIFTICVLANAPGSPWAALSKYNRIPVLLYACSAMVAGYLVAYWYLLMSNRAFTTAGGTRVNVKFGVWLGYIFTVPTMVIIAAATLVNAPRAFGRRGAFADACARDVIDGLDGRRWIISDSVLDCHLLLESARAGRDIKLISLMRDNNPAYIRQLKTYVETEPEFENLNRVRLRNSADLGALAFLQDWLADDPSASSRMAAFNTPDIFVGAKLTVAPCLFCFVGAPDLDSLRDVDFLAEYNPFWDRMEKLLPRVAKTSDAVETYRNLLRRQIGFVGNNLGVLLEDLDRPDEAFEVYRRVRKIDPENASALLNLVEMVSRGYKPELRDELEKELKEFVDNLSGRLPVWSLSRHYGYVRSPMLFAQLGWTWAMSGQPSFALSGLTRALELAPDAARVRIQQAMANMLLQQDEEEESEAIYEEILKSNPGNRKALISMARIATRQGSIDKAREWLEKAQNAGVDTARLAVEWASVYLASGEAEKALLELTPVTELQQNNLQAWGLMAVAQLQLDKLADAQKTLERMESITGSPDHFLIQVTRGQLAYRQGEDQYSAARDAFERAYALRPSATVILEWLLRLDFMMNDKRRGETHARQLLRVSRDNSFANYIMGSVMMDYGRNEEAEEYLRRSVASTRTAASLNDLAELLHQTGRNEDAEKYAREAISMKDDLYAAYDTLGGILADTGRTEEAEAMYLKAIELFSDDPRVSINLASLYLRNGNRARALEIVNGLQKDRAKFPKQTILELDRLSQELKPKMR